MYGDWIAEVCGTHLHGHVLEVGCGHGAYSSAIARLQSVTRVTAVDLQQEAITAAMHGHHDPKVSFVCADIFTLPARQFDSVMCANVLEHIEDEHAFVQQLLHLLRPGGSLVILVPAHENLYSSYDLLAGHYRRYTATTLQSVLVTHGVRCDRLFYFNAIGALGWWFAFCRGAAQIQSKEHGNTRWMIRLFNSVFLPISRSIERFIRLPFGLSCIACLRSTGDEKRSDASL